jgi:cytoskeletal protein RodZ
MNIFKKREGDGRSRPAYILRGRIRTSTAGLILAFVALFWVNQTYQPEPPAPAVDPAQQVVPPGFVPDPNYTWVPRTNVRPREPEYTTTTPRTTTTTTTTTSPTTTVTDEPATTTAGVPGLPTTPTTTVIDPDGPGPLSPQTFTQQPPSALPTTAGPAAPTQTTTPPWP